MEQELKPQTKLPHKKKLRILYSLMIVFCVRCIGCCYRLCKSGGYAACVSASSCIACSFQLLSCCLCMLSFQLQLHLQLL